MNSKKAAAYAVAFLFTFCFFREEKTI